MNTAKEDVLHYIRRKYYLDNNSKGLATNEIAKEINMQRTHVSTILNELVRDGIVIKTKTRPVLYRLSDKIHVEDKNKIFEELTGASQSLKKQIQLAKAAVLYSNKSLNVMLTGSPGSGISTFVEKMYQFAIESHTLKKDASFVKINCKVFSDDVSILDDIIFGDSNPSTSSFERARGGMLFIDGFDLLNANQQSRILNFIETGIVKMGNSKNLDYSDVYLVISVVNAPSNILNNKIPVKIHLPDLKDWTFENRLELINKIFFLEGQQSQRNIKVNTDVIKALLLTDFSSNIKELSNEIVTACANAYIRVIEEPEKEVSIYADDFKSSIKRNLMLAKKNRNSLEKLGLATEFVFYDKNAKQISGADQINLENTDQEQSTYDDLTIKNISLKDMLNSYIESIFEKYRYIHDGEDVYFKELSKLIDHRIIPIVRLFVKEYENLKNTRISTKIFLGLCFHIDSILKNSMSTQRVDNNQIVDIIQKYPDEYVSSTRLSKILKEEIDITLDISETVIFVLFLIETEEVKAVLKPVLLYILHGKGTASSLAQVTNSLAQTSNTYGYDMTLEKSPEEALGEILTLIREIDSGEGVIVIYDMGSIATILDTISEETNVKIRYLNIPITLTGINAARKCDVETNIDTIFHSLNIEMNRYKLDNDNNKVIITLCNTGEGGAVQLKNYIDNYSYLGMKTIPLAISDKNKLYEEVSSIRKIYNIHSFVGTYDPKLLGIPFISIQQIFKSEPTELDSILLFKPNNVNALNYELIYKNLEEQFIYTSIVKIKNVLPSVVNELSLIYNLDSDRTIGLFVHLACLIERILSGEDIKQSAVSDEKLMTTYLEDYRIIGKSMKKIEKTFKIIINNKEISTILLMVNNY